MSTRRTLAAVAALGLGTAAVAATVMSPAGAAPTTETFEFTGEAEDFVVPEGVCEVTVDAYGAEGGVASDGLNGGLGGHTTGTFEVTPGETLIVRVGGAGGDATNEPPGAVAEDGTEATEGGGFPGEGGFNGGADGGGVGASDPGGGGGGATDIRQGGDGLGNRVVVAGGGGGSGGDGNDESAPAEGGAGGAGGDGGGAEGDEGQDSSGGSDGGDGGTEVDGGAAGTTDPTAGDGTLGQGGVGGDSNDENDAGGGGGGGHFGGGGGAGEVQNQDNSPGAAEGEGVTFNGAGGGGGSGYGPPGVVFETGVREGNGLLTITYDPAAETCPPDVIDDDVDNDVIEATPPFTG